MRGRGSYTANWQRKPRPGNRSPPLCGINDNTETMRDLAVYIQFMLRKYNNPCKSGVYNLRNGGAPPRNPARKDKEMRNE